MGRDRPAYDYLLIAGPGRSGSTFLYQILNGHAMFVAPVIKEGYLYRSPACQRVGRRAEPSAVRVGKAGGRGTSPRWLSGSAAAAEGQHARAAHLLPARSRPANPPRSHDLAPLPVVVRGYRQRAHSIFFSEDGTLGLE